MVKQPCPKNLISKNSTAVAAIIIAVDENQLATIAAWLIINRLIPIKIELATIINLQPIRSVKLPANGRRKLLIIVPNIYAKLSSVLLSERALMSLSVKTPTPIVWPGMLARVPIVVAATMTQP